MGGGRRRLTVLAILCTTRCSVELLTAQQTVIYLYMFCSQMCLCIAMCVCFLFVFLVGRGNLAKTSAGGGGLYTLQSRVKNISPPPHLKFALRSLLCDQTLPWLRHNVIAQWLLLGSIFLQAASEVCAIISFFAGGAGGGRQQSSGTS